MPKYERTVATAPDLVLPEDVLLERGSVLVAALTYMHGVGRVHMDVKEENIFVDAQGEWFLGDFGSSVPTGTPITSTTPGLHPGLDNWQQRGLVALPVYDLHMAAGVLMRQLRPPVATDDSGPTASAMRERAASVAHNGLRELLLRIV